MGCKTQVSKTLGMMKIFDKNYGDPINRIIAFLVFLIALITYLRTVQPTVPYWDCGEFIACAATLSVPHPPGTPLFMLLGKVFASLPIGDDIGWRVNLISVITSALAVLSAYILITTIIRKWYTEVRDIYQRATIYVGGIVGALVLAFSRTFWTNAVEAEVYGANMLFMMVMILLVIKWSEHLKDKKDEKYIIAFSFLAVLSLGFHMTAFLVVPFAFVYIILTSRKYMTSIPIWITFIILCMIPLSFTAFLVCSTVWATLATVWYFWERIKGGYIYSILLPGAVTIFLNNSGYSTIPLLIYSFTGWSLITAVIFKLDGSGRYLRIAMLSTILSLIGFSVQLYAPLRSAQNPPIDMNDPETWDKTIEYIERRQYGSENMFVRMLHRRGELSNQFGTHERMGFWGFFHDQYSSKNIFLPFIFLLGMIGGLFTIRQKWRLGTFMFLILLASTVGLVLYMNFADGTHEHPITHEARLEVRDRDYFFTPGFMIFGMFVGIGVAAVMKSANGYLKKINAGEGAQKLTLAVLCLSVSIPALAYAHNYHVCDRSNNYLPYYFAHNLLDSCKEDAILFTNGDNDTFPVWCLQYAYGIRRDVRVIVLSLLRTDWNIKEQRDKNGVPITLSDFEISHLEPRLLPNNEVYYQNNFVTDNIIDNTLVKSSQPEKWPELPLKFIDFQKLDPQRSVGDTSLYFDPPIHFANSVNSEGLKYKYQSIDQSPIDGVIEGIVFNIYPNKRPVRIDADFTSDYFLNKFNCTGVTDPTIYKDENAQRMADNYWKILAKMADEIFNLGHQDEGIKMNVKSVQVSVDPPQAFRYLVKNLKYGGRLSELQSYRGLVDNSYDEQVLEQSCIMLDILFTQDLNRFRSRLSQSINDPGSLMQAIAQEGLQNTELPIYLSLLNEFLSKYPQNQTAMSLAERARQNILRYLKPVELDALNINTLAAGTPPQGS